MSRRAGSTPGRRAVVAAVLVGVCGAGVLVGTDSAGAATSSDARSARAARAELRQLYRAEIDVVAALGGQDSPAVRSLTTVPEYDALLRKVPDASLASFYRSAGARGLRLSVMDDQTRSAAAVLRRGVVQRAARRTAAARLVVSGGSLKAYGGTNADPCPTEAEQTAVRSLARVLAGVNLGAEIAGHFDALPGAQAASVALSIAASVVEFALLEAENALDDADCTSSAIFNRAKSTDVNVARLSQTVDSIGGGINDGLARLDVIRKLVEAIKIPDPTTSTSTSTTVVDPAAAGPDIAALLDALRVQLQRTAGSDTQLLSARLQTLQSAVDLRTTEILQRLAESAAATPAPVDSSVLVEIEQALVAPSTAPTPVRLLLPSSASGLLDTTPGVRSVVVAALASATSAGLVYDTAAADAAVADGDAKLARKDFRGAFAAYQVAYQEVAR